MGSESLGARVRRLRAVAGLSGRELSALIGSSPSLVGHLERGLVTSPRGATLVALAAVLGADLDYLVSGQGAAPSAARVARAVSRARRSAAA